MKISQTEYGVSITPDERTVKTEQKHIILLYKDGSYAEYNDEEHALSVIGSRYYRTEVLPITRAVETSERGKLRVVDGFTNRIGTDFHSAKQAYLGKVPAFLIYEEPAEQQEPATEPEAEPEQAEEEPDDPEWRNHICHDLTTIAADDSIPPGYRQIAGSAESYIWELRNRIASLKVQVQDEVIRFKKEEEKVSRIRDELEQLQDEYLFRNIAYQTTIRARDELGEKNERLEAELREATSKLENSDGTEEADTEGTSGYWHQQFLRMRDKNEEHATAYRILKDRYERLKAELDEAIIQDDFSRSTPANQWKIVPNPEEGKAYPINKEEDKYNLFDEENIERTIREYICEVNPKPPFARILLVRAADEIKRLNNRMQESSMKQEEIIDTLTSDLYEKQGEIDKLKAELERIKSNSFEAWMSEEDFEYYKCGEYDRALLTIHKGKRSYAKTRVLVTVKED